MTNPMSAMTDDQVCAELERIDEGQETGFALVYKVACDFVNGIPLKGIDTPGDRLLIDALRLLAEYWQALGKIANHKSKLSSYGQSYFNCKEIARNARKGK